MEDERLSIDPNNVELSYAFADAKRKLRMVLSTADLQHIPWNTSEVFIVLIFNHGICVTKTRRNLIFMDYIIFKYLSKISYSDMFPRDIVGHRKKTN